MYHVIDRLVEALTSGSDPLLSADRLGPKKPTASVEIPAVVFSLQLDQAKGAGLGRFVRAGDTIVQSTSIIQVAPSVDTFSENLKTLRISPLPLKRNPSATTTKFGAGDISIKNVTQLDNHFIERLAGAKCSRPAGHGVARVFPCLERRADAAAFARAI